MLQLPGGLENYELAAAQLGAARALCAGLNKHHHCLVPMESFELQPLKV